VWGTKLIGGVDVYFEQVSAIFVTLFTLNWAADAPAEGEVVPGEEGEAPLEPAISLPLIFTWWPTSLLSLESSPCSCQVLPELSVKVQLPAEPDKHPSMVFPSVSLVCEELTAGELGLAAGEVLCATSHAEHSSRRAVNNQNFLITSP